MAPVEFSKKNFHLVAPKVASIDNVLPDFLSCLSGGFRPAIPDSLLSPSCCFHIGSIFKTSWAPTKVVGWLTQPRPPE